MFYHSAKTSNTSKNVRTIIIGIMIYKWEDLTSKSVESLIVQGIEDAKKALKQYNEVTFSL